MSKKTPYKILAEKFQAAKEQCDLTPENLKTLAEVKSKPTMSQISTLKNSMSNLERNIAVEKADGFTDSHILTAHSDVKPEHIDKFNKKLAAVEWISKNQISTTQAKAIKDIGQSGQTFGREKHPVLSTKFTEVEFYKHSRALVTNDPQDLYDLRSMSKNLTVQDFQDAIDGKSVSKLTDSQREIVKRLGQQSDEHLGLTAEDMKYFQNSRTEIKLSHIKILKAYLTSQFDDVSYSKMPQHDVLACLQKDHTKDLSQYNFDADSLRLVLDEGVFAKRTGAELKEVHDVAAVFSPQVEFLTPAHLEKIKGLAEGNKLTTDDLAAIAAFKTATATADDVINVAELVKAGIASADIKAGLTAQAVVVGQPITFTTNGVSKVLEGSKVTATLIAAKNSFDTKDVTLKAIKTKAVVDAVNDLKTANHPDNKIIAASGVQSDVAASIENYRDVVQKFKPIINGDATDVQIDNVRAAHNTSLFDSEYSIRLLTEIARNDAASPSQNERKVLKAVLDAVAAQGATVSTVETAASLASLKDDSAVLAKVREASKQDDVTVDLLKIAALKGFASVDNCKIHKPVAKLTGLVKSLKSLAPAELFDKDLSLNTQHISGLSGNASITPNLAHLIIKTHGRSDGVKTNCELQESFGDLLDAKSNVEALDPKFNVRDLFSALHRKHAEKGVVTEADVNHALGRCTTTPKVVEFIAQGGLDPLKGAGSAYINDFVDSAFAGSKEFKEPNSRKAELVKAAFRKIEDAFQVDNRIDDADFDALEFAKPEMFDGVMNALTEQYCKGYGFHPIVDKTCGDFRKFAPKTLDADGKTVECPKSDTAIADIISGTKAANSNLYKLVVGKVIDVAENFIEAGSRQKYALNEDNFALKNLSADQSVNKQMGFDVSGAALLALKDITAKNDTCKVTKAELEVKIPVSYNDLLCFSGSFDDELYMAFKDNKGKILKEFKSDGFDKLTTSCDNFKKAEVKWCFKNGEYDYDGTVELEVKTGGSGFLDGSFSFEQA